LITCAIYKDKAFFKIADLMITLLAFGDDRF
jgi:hypothetical protein